MLPPINSQPPEEPSVLDYVRSRLRFWEKNQLTLEPSPEHEPSIEDHLDLPSAEQPVEEEVKHPSIKIPWLLLFSLILALLAQVLHEPSANRSAFPSVFFYGIAAATFILAYFRSQVILPPVFQSDPKQQTPKVRLKLLAAAFILSFLAFLLFTKGYFNFINLLLWLGAVGCIILAFWETDGFFKRAWQRMADSFKLRQWHLLITPWKVLIILVIGLIALFHFYKLNELPGEMISDQAERVLSVSAIIKGDYPIFFPRSTTSEPLSFYWSAFVSSLFGLEASFLGLKLASALAGMFMLIYLYKLGKLLGGKWTGLFALIIAGYSFWANLQARAALGGIFFPALFSASLYYLVKGLREFKSNALILSGVFTGLGLLSSRESLVLPLVNLLIILIFWLHHRKGERSSEHLWAVIILAVIGIVFLTPIFRVMVNDPQNYFFRIFSRLSNWERPLPGNGLLIFLKNFFLALVMPFWSNASSWVDGVRRPAVDVISAVLFFFGWIAILIRYIRSRDWLDLVLLIAYPVLLLPSVFSLAFPEENPSLSRAAGSMIPVFLMAAFALKTIVKSLQEAIPGRKGVVVSVILVLLLLIPSVSQNKQLVFSEYQNTYQVSSHNTREIAAIVKQFGDTIGSYDRVWVIGFPHWVDTRTLAIEAGLPGRDLSIQSDQLSSTQGIQGTKLFILNSADLENQAQLTKLYPNGLFSEYASKQEGKNFMLFLVPSNAGQD